MFGWPAVNNDGRPCCITIGFDQSPWSWISSCLTNPTISALAGNISKINDCQLIFAGNNGTCGNAMRFPSVYWSAIKTWVENGGRLFICAEHSGNGPGFPGFINQCLQDMPTLNSFLGAMGSTMQYVGNDYNASTPQCSADYYQAGAANIAQGLTFTGERFGEISGGTSLWVGNKAGTGGSGSGVGKVAVAVEAIGNGFIAVSGDSNHQQCTGYCPFLKRWRDYDSANII